MTAGIRQRCRPMRGPALPAGQAPVAARRPILDALSRHGGDT
ncbi:hypothetical protein [Streptosporangium sp. NPDC003464]